MSVSERSFRAARALLGMTQEQVAAASGVERRVLTRLEQGTYVRVTDPALNVRIYYEQQGLKFLHENDKSQIGVRWKRPTSHDILRRTQLHAARVLVGLTQPELAEKAGIGRTALTRFENGKTSSPAIFLIDAVKEALSHEGVRFLSNTDEEGFGVVLQQA